MNNSSAYDEQICNMYVEEHMAMNKIAKELNISVGKVYNRLKFMNITSRALKDYPTSEKVIRHITALGKACKGRKVSAETKAKQSQAMFKGGIGHKKVRNDGYVSIYFPEHPKSNNEGYIMEHILVMECNIGRHLKDDEVVHHRNHNRADNRLINLQLMTFKEHAALHMKERHEKRRNDISTK